MNIPSSNSPQNYYFPIIYIPFPFFVQTCRKTSISLVYHLTRYITLSLQILKNVLKRPVLVMNMLHVRNFKDLLFAPATTILLETGRTVKVRTTFYWFQMYWNEKQKFMESKFIFCLFFLYFLIVIKACAVCHFYCYS